MNEAGLLNARVGRVWPHGFAGGSAERGPGARKGGCRSWVRIARAAASRCTSALRWPPVRLPRAALPLLLLLTALWPHWVWLARRLTDGSDEPWGWLALATVLALVWKARRELQLPSPGALVAAGALAVAAAALTVIVPPIFAAAVAMLALAAFITSALPRRPGAPIVALLLLSLPVIASLQFYLGYPLRLATAHAAAPLLAVAGIEARAAGAALLWNGRTILVDPPCAGIGMLWVGSWAAALASYLNDATARRSLANGCVAAVAVFIANVLRNVLLFVPEAGLVPQRDWLHGGIGLAAFAAALLPVIAFASRRVAPACPPSGQVPSGRAPRPARLRLDAAAGVGRWRSRIVFVGACLAAAVLPPLGERYVVSGTTGREPVAAVGARSSAIEWPARFRGQPLTQLPPTALEARFAARFPGAVARFTDGGQLLIVRHVRRPTRLLHPAGDCFRGAGYTAGRVAAAVDDDGVHWRCFIAEQVGERLRVCERIAERLDDRRGWTDVSAWFWDAQFRRGAGAWWALTVVTPLPEAAP
jgi:exosortase/archaeosortase family protein